MKIRMWTKDKVSKKETEWGVKQGEWSWMRKNRGNVTLYVSMCFPGWRRGHTYNTDFEGKNVKYFYTPCGTFHL